MLCCSSWEWLKSSNDATLYCSSMNGWRDHWMWLKCYNVHLWNAWSDKMILICYVAHLRLVERIIECRWSVMLLILGKVEVIIWCCNMLLILGMVEVIIGWWWRWHVMLLILLDEEGTKGRILIWKWGQ